MKRIFAAGALLLALVAAPEPASAWTEFDGCVELTRLRRTEPQDRRWRCVPDIPKAGPGARWMAEAMIIVSVYIDTGMNTSALVACWCPGSMLSYNRLVRWDNFTKMGEPYPVEYHHFRFQDCSYSIGAGR